MLTYLRYALASVCFAASVACVIWWRWSDNHFDTVQSSFCDREVLGVNTLEIQSYFGRGYVRLLNFSSTPWSWRSNVTNDAESKAFIHKRPHFKLRGHFDKSRIGYGRAEYICYFTIWHFSLAFTLVGIVALLGRRFTIRSAIIATTVVAVLLGMAVIL